MALLDVHLYLFLSPSGTHATFTKHLLHPRIHLPLDAGQHGALQAQRYQVFLSLLRPRRSQHLQARGRGRL